MEVREDKIRKLLADILDIRKEDMPLKAKLGDELGADSLHRVEFIMALENAFGIAIPEADAQKIDCLKDAIDYISAHTPRS